MKKKILSVLLGVGALAALPTDSVADEAPTKSTVVVTVSTFRNKSGTFGCRLYKSSAGFPEQSAGTVERRFPISGGSASCTFDDLEAGTYAVSVLHDENDNRRLDRNFFGVPTEGYGASNNHTHSLSAPSWDESKFVVARGAKVALAIQLKY